MKLKRVVVSLILLILCLVVTIDYIYIQQKTRKKFVALQKLIKQENNLNTEFGQLQIQHSYYVNNSRIEKQAKQRLDMKLPQKEQVLNIKR
ncbi:MAG TPA: cell division protein FtsL [Oceanospirillales bacterium]|nr:cell division protein FtsL [Oceanospirillales bacterium]